MNAQRKLIVSPAWLQEYYVRHVDGHPARSDAERSRLVRCLEAAVERRASDVGTSSPVAPLPHRRRLAFLLLAMASDTIAGNLMSRGWSWR